LPVGRSRSLPLMMTRTAPDEAGQGRNGQNGQQDVVEKTGTSCTQQPLRAREHRTARMEQAGIDVKGRAPALPGNVQFGFSASRDGHERRAALAAATKIAHVTVAMVLSAILAGCGPQKQQSDTDLAAFEQAGPVRFKADYKQILRMRKSAGPYRLVPGDLLELQMPAVVRLLPDRQGDDTEPYRCRLDSSGRVVLPIIGNLKVAGKTLSEVEAALTNLYCPKYVRQEPSIVARVAEYRLSSISVVGAVTAPGVYELRSNEMTLIAALMKAGGITDEGAATIHIYGPNSQSQRSVSIDVLDMNIPAKDVELADGDTIIVEAMEPQAVTVVGLVKKPGMYPWNSKGKFTVMDALAFAGGVNDLADPQYVRVYRQDASGKITSVLVKLNGPSAVGASEVCLKPGDIVAVEQTPRTRSRLFLAQIIQMGVGVNAGASVGP